MRVEIIMEITVMIIIILILKLISWIVVSCYYYFQYDIINYDCGQYMEVWKLCDTTRLMMMVMMMQVIVVVVVAYEKMRERTGVALRIWNEDTTSGGHCVISMTNNNHFIIININNNIERRCRILYHNINGWKCAVDNALHMPSIHNDKSTGIIY